MKDELGDRMKMFYEARTKVKLPRKTYTIIRIDGKAFHTYTKGLNKPFDSKFTNDMDETAIYLCQNIQGAKFAFVQSDEISILLTDFEKQQTDAWFDGNVQKIVSVSASLATAKFNELRPNKIALFDSRAFVIPAYMEVVNYFVWRQNDTVRNSLSMLARSLYSQKEINNKNIIELHELCFEKGFNWNDLEMKYKRGRMIVKVYHEKEGATTRWISTIPPIFTQQKDYLYRLIPKIDYYNDKDFLKMIESSYNVKIKTDEKSI